MTDDRRRMVTNGDIWKRTGISSVVTAILTAGSMIGYWQIDPPRADPHTGREATEMRRELEGKINRLEIILNARTTALESQLVTRMVDIEGHDKQMGLEQVEIWRALAQLPPERWRRRIETLEVWVIRKDPAYQTPP